MKTIRLNDKKLLWETYCNDGFYSYGLNEFPYLGRLHGQIVTFDGKYSEYIKLLNETINESVDNVTHIFRPTRFSIIWNCIFNWKDYE